MVNLEKLKDLKRPVTQKTMYIAMIITLMIGLYIGNTYDFNNILGKDTDTASIIPSPLFAQIGDFITIRCSKEDSNSICGSRGYLKEGISTQYMVIWDTGATTHYKSAPVANETFEGKTFDTLNVTFTDHENARN